MLAAHIFTQLKSSAPFQQIPLIHMNKQVSPFLHDALDWWAGTVSRHPWWVLFLTSLLTILSTFHAVTHLTLNTNMDNMLSPSLPFRQIQEQYKQIFPKQTKSIVLVIEADTPEMAHAAVSTLDMRLRKQTALIKSVYTPGVGEFFEKHSLLYLDVADLETLAENLSESKPFIDQLISNPSLRGLFMMLSNSYDRTGWENERLLNSFFVRISEAIQATLAGHDYTLSWHSVILNQDPTTAHTVRFLVVYPNLDYHTLLPAGPVLQTIRRLVKDSQLMTAMQGVRVRITGEIALAHEELQIVGQRAGIAAFLALVMVGLTLFIGFRSLPLMLAALVTLVSGLLWSAGFAAATIGSLNIISVAFAVLFIGLGVDYAIHLSLRYRELLGHGESQEQALPRSIHDIGPALILCAVTTAIAFYSFIPTNYAGMAELGLISGTSMFIGLFASLTILPAILTLIPSSLDKGRSNILAMGLPIQVYDVPIRYGPAIRKGTYLLAALSLLIISKATFDYNPNNLRDPNSESVSTLQDMLNTRAGDPWTVSVLASDEETASDYVLRLQKLDTVDKVRTIDDFVPKQQIGKSLFFEEIASNFLSPSLEPTEQPLPPPAGQIAGLRSFLHKLDLYLKEEHRQGKPEPAVHLRTQLQTLLMHLKSLGEEHKKKLLAQLEKSLLGSIPTDFRNLPATERIGLVTRENLPAELRENWVSPNGTFRLQVFPKEDLSDNHALRNFVDQVRGIAPNATNLPVIYLDGGHEVIRAFQQAFITAVLAIVLIIWMVLGNIRDTLFVMLPLCFAGLLIGATSVLLNMPFNFANILALPLVFGLGADNGIHIVDRMRRMPTQCENFLRTSTIRGVFFSGLTTILSFSNLAYTPHLGISSMGQLLTIGVFFTLVSSLVVLPAFLYSDHLRG